MHTITKLLFAPFAALGGVVAGIIGKRLFRSVWSLVDKEDPPDPDLPGASWPKVLAALALEGAIFHTTRGAVDRSTRELFARFTGLWPGEPRDQAQAGADGP
jgi:hypothetical protein